MKIGTFGLLGAAAFASAASAAFTGWSSEVVNLNNGRYILNVYANFSDTGDRLLNCVNANITTNSAGGFYQSAANPFWAPGGTQNSMTSDDSWVTIDTNPNGNGNAFGGTSGDPNFVNFNDSSGTTTYDFSVIESAGTGAGWFNGNPSNSYGFADGGRVLAAHFVVTGSSSVVNWNVTCIVKLSNGQTVTGQGTGPNTFAVPAPGAIALLGAAGLASRRRRA